MTKSQFFYFINRIFRKIDTVPLQALGVLLINVFFGWNFFYRAKTWLTGKPFSLRCMGYVPFVSKLNPGFLLKILVYTKVFFLFYKTR